MCFITQLGKNAVLRPDAVILECRDRAYRNPHVFPHQFDYVASALVAFLGSETSFLGQEYHPQNEQR